MMKVKFPFKVLRPIQEYLRGQEKKLRKRKKDLSKEDPFQDSSRLNDNAALDTEAEELTGHERISTLKREIDKALIRIRKAMTRIRVGKYGLCVKCGEMINTDRLAVDPTAEDCIKCAKKK